MLKHLLVVTHPIFSNSKIMITISKFEKGLKPGDNVLKYSGISLTINGSFIVTRALYAHVFLPRLDKMCIKI